MSVIDLSYGSVCSGIESASVAWEIIGYKPLWFSEIEPFPCAVLAHHWPHVPNLGDMTQLASWIRGRIIPAPLILVGGTPCQDFSVAGKGESLGGDRGQLTITYGDIANAIDEQRELCADGPRYKAIGNSKAVPCIRFIGLQIIKELCRGRL